MGTRFEFKTQQAYDFAVNHVFEDLSLRQWLDEERDIEDDGMTALLEKLGVFLEFLGLSNHPRGMGIRVWCLLYAVRPDLINNETTQAAADRFGVAEQQVSQTLALMKKRTGITYRSRTGMTDLETQRRRVDAMTAGRIAKAKRFAMREEASP